MKAYGMEEIDDIITASGDEALAVPDEEENESSWILEDGAALKQTDRHTFLYRESIIPPALWEYFGVGDLAPGRKQHIVLRYGNSRFDAFIEKTMHTVPRIRMIWKQDFFAVLQKEYPQWLEYFQKSREESGDTPSIRFGKLAEPGHYAVELEGVVPEEAAGDFTVPLSPGDTIDNNTLHTTFRCSLLGPMRRSRTTNSLVLVSDHTQPENIDTWIGKVFHFTGMGTVGDQGPGSRQNKTLEESPKNGTALFLFEVFQEGCYVYIGEAELLDRPYRSRQVDTEKRPRDVLVFPLQLKSHKNPPIIQQEIPGVNGEPPTRRVRVVTHGEAGAPAEIRPETDRAETSADLFEPDAIVAEYAKRNANGICQLCGLPAPFTGHDGQPYLEVHHIVSESEGGADEIGNVVALCPNCHRKMHILHREADVVRLKNRLPPGI